MAHRMKRTPLQRKTPLRAKALPKPKREPWIKPKPKVDLSRMDCCPEAEARAEFLVSRPCSACRERGTRKPKGAPPRPDDMVIHHLRKHQGTGTRAPWWETIGLHHRCHAAEFVLSTHGGRRDEFHAQFGTELELLERTNARLPSSLCGPAA